MTERHGPEPISEAEGIREMSRGMLRGGVVGLSLSELTQAGWAWGSKAREVFNVDHFLVDIGAAAVGAAIGCVAVLRRLENQNRDR